MWLNQVSRQELGLLKEELRSSTFLLRYLTSSLETSNARLRYATGNEMIQAQGAAQLLEELLEIANQPRD